MSSGFYLQKTLPSSVYFRNWTSSAEEVPSAVDFVQCKVQSVTLRLKTKLLSKQNKSKRLRNVDENSFKRRDGRNHIIYQISFYKHISFRQVLGYSIPVHNLHFPWFQLWLNKLDEANELMTFILDYSKKESYVSWDRWIIQFCLKAKHHIDFCFTLD